MQLDSFCPHHDNPSDIEIRGVPGMHNRHVKFAAAVLLKKIHTTLDEMRDIAVKNRHMANGVISRDSYEEGVILATQFTRLQAKQRVAPAVAVRPQPVLDIIYGVARTRFEWRRLWAALDAVDDLPGDTLEGAPDLDEQLELLFLSALDNAASLLGESSQ